MAVMDAVATGTEMMTPWKAVFLMGIIGSVIGLKLVAGRGAKELDEDTETPPNN